MIQAYRLGVHIRRLTPLVIAVVGCLFAGGCQRGPKVVPVEGIVQYNGRPLEFGTVTFQPPQGQPARGEIQPDGRFVLSTFREGDGAVVGTHKVRITCYESQRQTGRPQPAGEQTLGKLLIPRKYTLFDLSGLTATVNSNGNEPILFELSDK